LRLKELRKNKGLTQQSVADSLGIERVAYARYENGVREPSIAILIRLSDFFGVSTDYLIGRSDNPMYEHKWISDNGTQNVLLSTTEKKLPTPSRRRELEKQAEESGTNEIVISKKDIPKNRKELEQFVLEILHKEQGKN
jgi:transcriptional regulator with XRE-family HTH domain